MKAGRLGLYLPDGLLLSNVTADIGGNPDATFISTAALDQSACSLVEGKKGGYVEVEGSPDMVLEVVSDSSVRKDTCCLRQAYWEAGIREYWLVDARREPMRSTFSGARPKATPPRKQDGWLKSAVFGKSFRLTQQLDERGASRVHAGSALTAFVPMYSVAIPNVNGCHFTSVNPCPRSFSANASPSGNCITLAGR